jgi:hypothetical protein
VAERSEPTGSVLSKISPGGVAANGDYIQFKKRSVALYEMQPDSGKKNVGVL